MADTKRLYRLKTNLSRNEESGQVIYGPGQPAGDVVRLTPAFAGRIGAELVSTHDIAVEEENRQGENKSRSSGTASEPTRSSGGDPDWSTLSTLSYEDAIGLVNGATTADQLKSARDAEMGTGGKKRRSVIEAISAKEKELAKKE
jgi:hypothetical protein